MAGTVQGDQAVLSRAQGAGGPPVGLERMLLCLDAL